MEFYIKLNIKLMYISGANVGLFCSTPAIPLSRCVNEKTAAFMLMTGNHITANGKHCMSNFFRYISVKYKIFFKCHTT